MATTSDTLLRENALALLTRLQARVGDLERERAPPALGSASSAGAAAETATGASADAAAELARLRDVVARQEYRIRLLVRSLRDADAKIAALGGVVE